MRGSASDIAEVFAVGPATKLPRFQRGWRRSLSRIPTVPLGISVRLTRLVTVLMASGVALLALAVALSLMGTTAATRDVRHDTSAYRYND